MHSPRTFRPAYSGGVNTGTSRPGDLLVRAGAIVFLVGALGTFVTFIPFFVGADPLPTAAYLVSMLMGVGFGLALAGLFRSAAASRREARQAAP
ncbi:hypothetical protein GCM10009802_25280 [Streptomyces synnematoformans]|uniref:Integral membrane protein n=1 Tax=Streptomyces synnematoformans TaxID=415721 RepID=A0ABN2Y3X6_9ACTN